MVANPTTQKTLTFEDFLDYDDGTDHCYELVDGRVVLMPEPSDLHEDIVQFLYEQFSAEIKRLGRLWVPRRNRVIDVPGRGELANGKRPDLVIVTKALSSEEAEKRRGIRSTPHLIVEVASGNWSNDATSKTLAYALLGVPEYWVLDYRGQIPAKDCVRGKGMKTIVFTLNGQRYDRQEYLGDEVIPCKTFPNLRLTTEQMVRCCQDSE
jgi:Uma2 family endonuclease